MRTATLLGLKCGRIERIRFKYLQETTVNWVLLHYVSCHLFLCPSAQVSDLSKQSHGPCCCKNLCHKSGSGKRTIVKECVEAFHDTFAVMQQPSGPVQHVFEWGGGGGEEGG